MYIHIIHVYTYIITYYYIYIYILLLVTRKTIYQTKELKSLVRVDTETNVNLKLRPKRLTSCINHITSLKIPLHQPDFVTSYLYVTSYYLAEHW